MQGYAQKVRNFEIRKFYLIFLRQIHYHLGYCLDTLGDSTGSLDNYKKALDLDPDNEIFHFTLGNVYIRSGDMPNAIAHFEKIVELNENNLMAMSHLALCYQNIGEDVKAEKFLRLIVDKDSESASAKRNLEIFLLRTNSL